MFSHSTLAFSAISAIVIMLIAFLLQSFWGLTWVVGVKGQFNNPPGVDIWCGKAYRATNSSFDPGGWLSAPTPNSPANQLKLDLRIIPRHNYYLPSDKIASFIIDTPVSYIRGTAYKNETFDPNTSPSEKVPFTEMSLVLKNSINNEILVNWTKIPVNASGVEVKFSLESMGADAGHGWTVSAIGNSPDGIQTFFGGAEVTVLPERNDTGSVARIDRLYGGIEVRSGITKNEWKMIFPYSFYTSWDWINSTIGNSTAGKNLTTFRELGYNIIHPVPPSGQDPYDPERFEEFLKICDDLELYVMYDMRHTYKNNTSISTQLARLQHHPSLLLYYTADEPDGWGDPLNATSISYEHIQSIDPYHPVSLVLNCGNFYFGEYTSGADIILEDTYPYAVNTSFSAVYHTACNTSYGDCGCDNCHANDLAYPAYVHNPYLDIVDRTENMYLYQEWLVSKTANGDTRKPVWGVPQAFWDDGSFWDRWPGSPVEAIMGLLRLNHGAKGIVAWIYPTSKEIEHVTSDIATVVTTPKVTSFLLGARRVRLETVGADGLLDAAVWVKEDAGEALIIWVNQRDSTDDSGAKIRLPAGITVGEIEDVYGGWDWTVADDGMTLSRKVLVGATVGISKAKVVK